MWGANTRTAIARWQTANRPTAPGARHRQEVRLIAEQAGTATGTAPGDNAAGDDAVEERLLGVTRDERGRCSDV